MSSIGDFQIVGLRRFGQVHAILNASDVVVTVFDGEISGAAGLTLESDVADSNKLVPTAPPSGFAGHNDLVRWTRNSPPGAPEWVGPTVSATTVLFTHHDESNTDYWVLYLPESGGFVLAFEGEVTLLEAPV